jgi:WD40 repeat protein
LQYLHRHFGDDGRLTLAEYRSLDGLEGSVRSQAEAAIPIEKLSEEDRRALRDAFVPGLVRASAQGGFSRSRALLATLPPLAEPHLRRLIDEARLLTTDTDPEGGVTVEVAHESLLRVWPTLARWIAEDAESLRRLETMQRAAQDWAQAGRDAGFLIHRDHRLAEAEALVAEPRFAASLLDMDRSYLAVCREAQNRREAEERQGRERELRAARRLLWGASVAAVVFLALSLLAWVQWGKAETQRMEAERQRDAARSREFAARATSQLAIDPQQSLLLAVEGAALDWNAETAGAVREALVRSDRRAMLGSPGAVSDARFDPTGKQVLGRSCIGDGQDCVGLTWNVTNGEPLCTIPTSEPPRYTVDGKYIVVGTNMVMNAVNCQTEPRETESLQMEAVEQPDLDMDTDIEPPTIHRSSDGTVLRALPTNLDPIGGTVFSNDGRLAVTWSRGNVYMESGGGPTEIGDKSARIWGVEYDDEDRVLSGHNRAINAAAFGPDAGFIVTGSDDRTARVWITRTGDEFSVLRGHQDAIESVAVSPDGSRILTIGYQGRAWLWEPGTGSPAKFDVRSLFALRYGRPLVELAGRDPPIEVPTLSEDGSALVALVSPNRIGVWDAATGQLRAVLSDDSFGQLLARPSPDGRNIVTTTGDPNVAAGDDFARVWDVASGQVIGKLGGAEGSPVYAAAYDPTGASIATGAEDGTVRLWDARTFEPQNVIETGSERVLDIGFNRDGSRLVTASRDSVARIWDRREGRMLIELSGHEGGVVGASFSPDDSLVVTVGGDNTRVWDANSGKQIGLYLGDGPSATFFTPDCSRLVTGTYHEEIVRVHPFGACGTPDQLMTLAKERMRLLAEGAKPGR